MKKFRDFESAREFTRKLKLKSQKEWHDYCKSGNKPDDIPSSPSGIYKNKGWINTGNWLGTENIQTQQMEFKSFLNAKKYIRLLGLKNSREWLEYCKSGSKPDDIPSTPHKSYKKEWNGFYDWLGTSKKQYQNFRNVEEFVRTLNLKSYKEWLEYCKSGSKPDDIPNKPDLIYKNMGWEDWGTFLGTGTIATNDRVYRPFKEAREFAISLNLKGQKEWFEYCKSGDKPDNIPTSPGATYKKDFKGYEDWLDNKKIFRPFKEAREFVRKLGLKGQKEWFEYCKSGNKPDDIPSTPWNVYNEWNKK
jgi:hypothetical protein